jgi:lipoprotein NlpI
MRHDSDPGAFDQDQSVKKIAGCTEAIRPDPANVNALNSRGILYAEQEECGLALADFNAVLRMYPWDSSVFSSAFFNRGLAYYSKGITTGRWRIMTR